MALGRGHQEGQAAIEYILLISSIIGFYVLISQVLTQSGFDKKLTTMLTGPFAAAYKYGHPKAKGYDEGSPDYHPRVDDGGNNNFRLFLNPRTN